MADAKAFLEIARRGKITLDEAEEYAKDPRLVHDICADKKKEITPTLARALDGVMTQQMNILGGDFTAYGWTREDVIQVSREWLLRFGDTHGRLSELVNDFTLCGVHGRACRWLRTLIVDDGMRRTEFDTAARWLSDERRNLLSDSGNASQSVKNGLRWIKESLDKLNMRPLPFTVNEIHADGVTVEWYGEQKRIRSKVFGKALSEICRTGTSDPVRTESMIARDNLKNDDFLRTHFRAKSKNSLSYLQRKD